MPSWREAISGRSTLMWPFDPNKQDLYQKYAQAYKTGDYSKIDPNEAQGQLQQFVRNAPPNEQEEVFQRNFAQMSPEQRAQLAHEFPPEYGANPNDPASMARAILSTHIPQFRERKNRIVNRQDQADEEPA